MKKYIVGFFAGLALTSIIAVSAVFNTTDELETAIKGITQIKQATHNGEPVFVMKFEGDLLGIPVSSCRLFWPNDLSLAPTTFTDLATYEAANPPRYPAGTGPGTFDEVEYLCWTPYETVIYGAADTGLAYDRVNAQFMSIAPGARCDAKVLGWPDGWHFLRSDPNMLVWCGPMTTTINGAVGG